MMNRIMVALSCFIFLFFLSCSKTEPNGTSGGLRPFNVTVVERTSLSATIQWDSCINTINNEVPRYRVILQNRVVQTDLSQLTASLTGLDKDTTYTGKVVAYISTGDSTFSSFTISTYRGAVYAATYYYTNTAMGRMGCFNAYPLPAVQPQPYIWRTNTSATSIPTVSNDTLFSVANYRLTATNARTGSTIWQSNASITFITPTTYYNGKLYACTNLGLAAINSTNGQLLWAYSSPIPAIFFNSTPVVEGDKVFIAITNFSGGELHAVNAMTGVKIWSAFVGESVCKRPLAANGVLVITSDYSPTVKAFNSNTGSILWTKAGSGLGSGADHVNPVLSNGNVLAISAGSLFAFNLQTGATIWEIDGMSLLEECIAGNGMVYFVLGRYASPSSNIYCVNATTGKVVWSNPLSASISYSDIVLAKDKLYCLLSSSVIYSNSLYTLNTLTGNTDPFFQIHNPIELSLYERINAFSIVRDGKTYYPAYHGNYN